LGRDSITSIIVDIPDYFHSSEWRGIAVCLALEPLNMEASSSSYVGATFMDNEVICSYRWSCKSPYREPDPKFPITSGLEHWVYEFNETSIHIILLSGDHRYIQHYLSGEQNNFN